MKEIIKKAIIETANEDDKVIKPENLTNETVLLDSGLDSLGFAILIAKLEEELGYDPFVIMDEPYYPRTLEELIEVYENNRPK